MVNIKKYKQIFLTDSRAYLQEMNNALVSLEKDLQNLDLIYLLYRKAHSLKGMADTMGYTHIGKLSHALESLLNKFKDGQKEISPLVIDLLFEGVDILEKQVDETASDLPQEVEYDEFLQKIEEVTILEGEVKSIERSIDPIPIRYNKPTTIPVDPELLDNLLSIVGDMIVNQSKLLMQSRDPSLRKMRENVLDSENLIRRLHTEVLQMRMIPLEVLAGAFPRVVRELSKTADKKVDFVVKGGDIKLDRAILDELWDPLVHLIRNALDHGIEPPAERKRKGKDVEGKISLWASREKDAILVGVEDDGNGIDIEKVREAAVKKNIILDKETFDEQSNEVLQILCTPNFTTSQRVTQVSGRGVGLDIVKSKVESLGGSLLVSSQPEKGSNWIIKLPTSLAIFHSLLFTLDSHVFAIPITKTLYTGEVFLDDEDYHKDEQTFVFRGTAVPIIDLKSVLDIPSKNEENRKAFLSIAIVEAKNRNIGLLVDEFVGVHQIFVKPLGQPLEKINAYCGVTFLGNGNAALLLDLEKLL